MRAYFTGRGFTFGSKAAALITALHTEAEVALMAAAKEHVAGMDEATPPRNSGAGIGKIAKDILQVLKGVPGLGEASPKAAHDAARDSSGQTSPKSPKVKVNRIALMRHLRRKQRGSGKAKSGWNPAKRALGLPIASHLARHGNGNGSFTMARTPDGPVATIQNSVKYTVFIRQLRSAIPESRRRAAESLQEHGAKAIKRALRAAGF
jgi:hypothetical protein